MKDHIINVLRAYMDREWHECAEELEPLINQEVEKRIVERMLTDEDIIDFALLYVSHKSLKPANRGLIKDAIIIGMKEVRSRLTNPNNSETESRRTLTDTEIKDIFNNGEPLCKQLHNEQQMWRDIQNKEREQ